jgi:hypothetical protein
MSTAEVALVRLTANLFLHPFARRAVVEYWLRHYTPPILLPSLPRQQEPGAAADTVRLADMVVAPVASPPLTAGGWTAALVRALLRGPTDLALVGRGNYSTTAPGARRWKHWFTAFELAPGTADMCFAVRIGFLERYDELQALLLSWHLAYKEVRHMWHQRSAQSRTGTLMGEHVFDFLRDARPLERLYPRALLVAEVYWRIALAVVEFTPAHLLQSEGSALLREAAAPLADGGNSNGGDAPALQLLHQLLTTQAQDVASVPEQLWRQVVSPLSVVACSMYKHLSTSLGYGWERVRPEDAAAHLPGVRPPLAAYEYLTWTRACDTYFSSSNK